MPENDMVPVTILTGFLGSGKTTLLNRILKEDHGQRIAVIENEFGESGVDSEIIEKSEEQIVEMNNGCICCTVRGDLIRILGSLKEKRDQGALKFDRVVIETTGMADPGPVAQTFFTDEEIGNYYLLDSIITLVDAKHAPQAARRIPRGAGAGGLCGPHSDVQDRPGFGRGCGQALLPLEKNESPRPDQEGATSATRRSTRCSTSAAST